MAMFFGWPCPRLAQHIDLILDIRANESSPNDIELTVPEGFLLHLAAQGRNVDLCLEGDLTFHYHVCVFRGAILLLLGYEIPPLIFCGDIDLHAIDRDARDPLRRVEKNCQVDFKSELLHEKHWRDVTAAFMAQHDAFAFYPCGRSMKVLGQQPLWRDFGNADMKNADFDFAVESLLEVLHRLVVNIGLDLFPPH